MHGLRALFNFVAILGYFTSLGLIPLAQITALGFTSPVFASLLAVLLLGEAVRTPRVVGLLLGFAGALIILRPGFETVSAGSLYVLGSAASWAVAMTCIKALSRTETSVAITFYAAFLQLPMALVAALFVWEWPTPGQLGLLLTISIIGTLAQISLSQAFREADSTVVLPMDFTKLVCPAAPCPPGPAKTATILRFSAEAIWRITSPRSCSARAWTVQRFTGSAWVRYSLT